MRHIFIIFLVTIQFYTAAQIPDYFANNPTWHVIDYGQQITTCGGWVTDINYFIDGDTTIDG